MTSPTTLLFFLNELLFNTLDSIDWQSFKVATYSKKRSKIPLKLNFPAHFLCENSEKKMKKNFFDFEEDEDLESGMPNWNSKKRKFEQDAKDQDDNKKKIIKANKSEANVEENESENESNSSENEENIQHIIVSKQNPNPPNQQKKQTHQSVFYSYSAKYSDLCSKLPSNLNRVSKLSFATVKSKTVIKSTE